MGEEFVFFLLFCSQVHGEIIRLVFNISLAAMSKVDLFGSIESCP